MLKNSQRGKFLEIKPEIFKFCIEKGVWENT